jgi:hypothetical protein
VSKLGSQRKAKYNAINRAFLAPLLGTPCPVALAILGEFRPISQTHHVRGRVGDLLFDTRHFLAVSDYGQAWIHANPREARKRGWLVCNACVTEAMEVFLK